MLRRMIEIAQFIAFAALIIWGVARGAQAMDYAWKWYRVPEFVVRVVDGAWLPGPLLNGLFVTLEISVLALALTIVIGLGAAILRLSGSPVGGALVRVYLELIRNTPLLVQIYLFYFIIAPILGIDRFWAGVLALAVFEGSFATEIFRAGIEAVPRGQWEAAASVGLRRAQVYRLVVLPQALRVVLPPLTGLGVSLIKHSAIVSVIAVFDLSTEARNLISDTFLTFEIWLTTAAIYLAVTVTLSFGVGWIETRLKS
jgi:polar amino acid transport system permease protein